MAVLKQFLICLILNLVAWVCLAGASYSPTPGFVVLMAILLMVGSDLMFLKSIWTVLIRKKV